MKIFVAGATGALGKSLIRQLLARGHQVSVMTRGREVPGARRFIADAFDAPAVMRAVAEAAPEVVVHQLTALAGGASLRNFDRAFALTNRLRTEGLETLIAAARAARVRQVVAQSFAGWDYQRSGQALKTEDDPLDPTPPRTMSQTLAAIRRLEALVAGAGGVALRYGSFYGPGTGLDRGADMVRQICRRRLPLIGDGAGVWSWVQIDDAAAATVLAIERGATGVYNVVDDEPAPVRVWLPELARLLGAPPPRHLPVWLARPLAGEAIVSMMTSIRGVSNARAREVLGWRPAHASWRTGFRALADAPAARAVRGVQACPG
jgi:nucleoside-diphosphate-sugar epimerase